MSKYDPLWEYIKTNAPAELSFDGVQRRCGFPVFCRCGAELNEEKPDVCHE